MLGIAVYLSSLDEDYITKAAQLGVKWVFTSLHIPEEDFSQISINLPRLLALVKANNLNCMVDISPVTFDKLRLKANDFDSLKSLGLEWVRLDFGYDNLNEILEIGEKFKLVLNASTLNCGQLKLLIDNGLDVSNCVLMHNFYPLNLTGLASEKFHQLSHAIANLGFSQMAFVAGERMRRLPMYEGLPTLEQHRGLNSYVAGLDLWHQYHIDWVVVGDPQTKLIHLKWLNEYITLKILTLPVYFNFDETLYDQVLCVRPDSSRTYIRLNSLRSSQVPIMNNVEIKRGAILQVNGLGKRYSGELGIAVENMGFNARYNVIGFIHPEYLNCLNYVDERVKLRFVRLSEDKL